MLWEPVRTEDEEFERKWQEIPEIWGDTYFHYMQMRT